MAVPIEDTIIAYLDGHLNDTEGAELLHRVSVSPEIRQIFQEHEALRQVAFRAARNAAVPTELEESVFARVAALEDSRDRALPVSFWSMPRVAAMAGTAAVIALALLAPWRAGETNLSSNHSVITASLPAPSAEMASATSDLNAGISTASVPSTRSIAMPQRNATLASAAGLPLLANNIPAAQSPQSESDPVMQLIPKPSESDRINMPDVGNYPQTLRSLRGLPDPDDAPLFEIGIASDAMPGFNAPANVIGQTLPTYDLATEFAIRLGFNLDVRNQIGIRFTHVEFPYLDVSNPIGQFYTVANSSFESQVGYAGELFYKHREPIDDGQFYVSGSVGGGWYTNGTLLSCELGLEVPVSEHVIGGVSLILSRLHQYEQSPLTSSEPVIYEGPNIYNSLAGRMEYGITYRF
jgi:hypothetical protein